MCENWENFIIIHTYTIIINEILLFLKTSMKYIAISYNKFFLEFLFNKNKLTHWLSLHMFLVRLLEEENSYKIIEKKKKDESDSKFDMSLFF